MNKRLLSLGVASAIMFSALGGAVLAYANEVTNEITPRRYTGGYGPITIPVINDKEIGPAKKVNATEGVNNVTTVSGDLVCWMESSTLGKNLTNKVPYNTKKRVLMTYKDGQSQINKMVKLNISTASHYLKEGKSGGSWSPDEK